MLSNKTVILGEASEESDGDEISLKDEEVKVDYKKNKQNSRIIDGHNQQDHLYKSILNPRQPHKDCSQMVGGGGGGGTFSSALFASIGSASNFAKLVNNSAFNLLATTTSSLGNNSNNNTSTRPIVVDATSQQSQIETKNDPPLPPLLHRTLHMKNQQFYACMTHLYRHPYEKAAKDFHNINQRLVCLQKIIQDSDIAVTKIKREKKNLDLNINLLA